MHTHHHIIGDARRVLELLNEKLPARLPQWKEWVFSHKEVPLKKGRRPPPPRDAGDHSGGHRRGRHRRHRRGPASDVVRPVLPLHPPGQLITSGGFGTMGFGLGAAMGAKWATPARWWFTAPATAASA